MELQLGGKHIIINEAERIAAVDSHVRTGVAISVLYPTSLCAIGGVSISFPDPPDDGIACVHAGRSEVGRRSELPRAPSFLFSHQLTSRRRLLFSNILRVASVGKSTPFVKISVHRESLTVERRVNRREHGLIFWW